MASKRTCIIVTLVVLILGAFAINFYFVYYLNNEEANRVKGLKSLEKNIYHKVRHLHASYLNRNPLFFMYRNKLLRNYKPSPYENASVLWDIVNWVSRSRLYIISFLCSLVMIWFGVRFLNTDGLRVYRTNNSNGFVMFVNR